jgi:hypothetical protein
MAPRTKNPWDRSSREPDPGPPQVVTERIRTDTDKWRGVVAKAGIKAE